MTESNPHARRLLLAQLVRFLFFIGLIAFGWVIISSLTFTHNNDEDATHHGHKVDLTQLMPGQLTKVTLRQREVWIYHRTAQDIAQLKKQGNPLRSKRDKFFVFFPYEPRRQCVVNWDQSIRSFYDTCNARYFDLAGRVTGDKGTAELPVPEYHFISGQLIQIDAH